MAKKIIKPWPTKDVMTQIYEKHFWGGKDHDYYSGEGSHDAEIITPYLNAVTEFLESFPEPKTVCDLGCGDFNIGRHLVEHSKTYTAVDIVESLVERNSKIFKADNLKFYCLDISKDQLPKADCVIIRQVLQHLSNTEIKNILEKLTNYKYIILTEHIPVGNFEPNKDIISGQGNRLKHKSGVNVLAAPFNFKVEESSTLTEYILDNKSKILTTLFKTV